MTAPMLAVFQLIGTAQASADALEMRGLPDTANVLRDAAKNAESSLLQYKGRLIDSLTELVDSKLAGANPPTPAPVAGESRAGDSPEPEICECGAVGTHTTCPYIDEAEKAARDARGY